MSILGAAEGDLQATALILIALLGICLPVAMAAGVFRRRSIVGPVRLSTEEPIWPFLLATATGWLMLFAGPGALLLQHPAPGTATRPIEDQFTPMRLLNAQLINFVTVIVFLVVFAITRRKTGPFGLGPGQIRRALPAAAIGAVVAIPLTMVASIGTEQVLRLIHYTGPLMHPMLTMLNESVAPWEQITIVVSATVLAPIAEEMLFRGYIQTVIGTAVSDWFGGETGARARWVAVVLTAVIFALHHPSFERAPIFVLAICLGYAYERTGYLWVPMLMHASFNTFGVALDWYANHHGMISH